MNRRRIVRTLTTLALIAGSVVLTTDNAIAAGFDEQFSSTTLDPAWTVVPGVRGASGFSNTPNHHSLTDNPGHLRYGVNEMTHYDGYLNGYAPTFGFHSCCTHDPGLELHRSLSGDNWMMEAKASYFMPFSNGRHLTLRVYFGDGGAGTVWAEFVRWRDGPWPSGTAETQPVYVQLKKKIGASLGDAYVFPDSYLEPAVFVPTNPDEDTYVYRLEREGGVLTASWSYDGATWTEAWSHDLGTDLDGLDQRVVIAGLSWFTPAGSYADYDYITVDPVDVTAPDITITTPADEASYELGASVLADYACVDETDGSGLASCTGPVADGAAIDTATVGAKTFTVDAADNEGNESSLTHDFAVVYDYAGFFPPVDAAPVLNSVKAGSSVPVKFGLDGDQGLDVFADGYPKSQTIDCDATADVDGIEETTTAGASSLAYDSVLDQYTYVWKTAKAWAGTCRQLVMKLSDGTSHRANFKLK